MSRILQRLGRLFPLFGLVLNKLRYPSLRMRVGVDLSGDITYGRGISLGNGTRFEIAPGGKLRLDDEASLSLRVHLMAGTQDRLTIGRRVSIQDDCRIYGDVTLGAYCLLAPNVFISSGTHVFNAAPHLPIFEQERVHVLAQRHVDIGEDCWLGINVVIMPGVSIGRGCIIGANSVVTSSIPPYSVAAGIPARVIKPRLVFAPPARIVANCEQDRPYFYRGFDFLSKNMPASLQAGTDFTVALACENARSLRLALAAGPAGHVQFGAEIRPMDIAETVLEFALTREQSMSCLFEFSISSGRAVLWAELQ